MNRRDFLRANGSMCAGWALSRAVPAFADSPSVAEWRTFEVVTRVELLKPDGVSHIWLPAPLIHHTPYQNTISTRFTATNGTATLSRDKQSALGIVSGQVWCKCEGGSDLDQPSRAEKLRSRFVLQGSSAVRATDRAELLPSAQPVCADRRHCQTDCPEGNRWRDDRHREGAGYL
jgi:hypothetical protein